VTSVGQYVSSENGTSAWVSTSTGVTGASAPTGQRTFNDGGVDWTHIDMQMLLPFLNTGVPTPA
jgi:hypothetical protein